MTYTGEGPVAAQLMRFYYDDNLQWGWARKPDIGVWIALSQVLAVAVNFLPVKVGTHETRGFHQHIINWRHLQFYGRMEYCFGAIKVASLSVLIFVLFLINIGKCLSP
jgi:amino acid permease